MQHDLRFVISGGGTGGHIFPAIAIANALKRKTKAEILFVGGNGKSANGRIRNKSVADSRHSAKAGCKKSFATVQGAEELANGEKNSA
jgi:UDP-N-acetylglucosamine:LPS N-acetylglucosamine transferase